MQLDPSSTSGESRLLVALRRSYRPLAEWLIWTILVAVVYNQTSSFDRTIQEYAFGATGWPTAICFGIILGATGQLGFRLLANWRSTAGGDEAGKPTKDGSLPAVPKLTRANAQVAGFFLLPLVYLYFAQLIGFYVATPFFILGLLALMEVRSARALLLVTLVVYGIALTLFTRFFYVALPVGRLELFYDINNAIIVLARTGV